MDDQKFESASLDVRKKKRSPKSRHINVMRRRINKWINSPNRGNICIETLTHPLREGKALISLRQVHKGEKRFGDVIMIHSDHLDEYIKQLQSMKEKIRSEEIKDIVIDEWDLKAEQSKLRKKLSEFAAEQISRFFWPVVKETCYACEINEPSQRRHQCCKHVDRILDELFPNMLERVNWREIREINENIDTGKLLDDDEWCEKTIETLRGKLPMFLSY